MSAKMRWVEITDPAELEMLRLNQNIGAPFVYEKDGHYWAEAEEMRVWRALEYKTALAIGNGAAYE